MRIRSGIRKNFSRTAASLALALTVSLAAPVTAQAMAPAAAPYASVSVSPATITPISIVGSSQTNPGALPRSTADTGTIQNIIRIFFGIIGAFALLSMTASGLKYVTSGGDPGKTSEAKKGIVFALLGLMIAISAEAIVAYVVKNGAP